MGCVMVNVRVQVDFSEERVAELEKLMRLCGLNTKKELLNNALTLFEWAVREVNMQHIMVQNHKSRVQFARGISSSSIDFEKNKFGATLCAVHDINGASYWRYANNPRTIFLHGIMSERLR
jgi:hypothetical protein